MRKSRTRSLFGIRPDDLKLLTDTASALSKRPQGTPLAALPGEEENRMSRDLWNSKVAIKMAEKKAKKGKK